MSVRGAPKRNDMGVSYEEPALVRRQRNIICLVTVTVSIDINPLFQSQVLARDHLASVAMTESFFAAWSP